MSEGKELLGGVCGHIPQAYDGKSRYIRMGTAFKDKQGRISIKLDTIPIPGAGWVGWVNIFPPKGDRPKTNSDGGPYRADIDDDIPF